MMNIKHVVMAATVAVTSGCAAEGLSHEPIASNVEYRIREVPFHDHSFDARCRDTLKCLVLYDNKYVVNSDELTGPLTTRDLDDLGFGWGKIDPPSVARVTWVSKDGTKHDEQVDIGKVVRSWFLRYPIGVDTDDAYLIPHSGHPEINLVIEDRSIYVYVKRWVPQLVPSYPDREDSNVRQATVLAYSHKF